MALFAAWPRTGQAAPGRQGIAGVAGGTAHVVAFDFSGAAFSWGGNFIGQLGRGGTTSSPGAIGGLPPVSEVVAGASFTLAVTGSGAVYAFGDNQSGQLGLGDTTSRSVPTLLSSLPGPAVHVSGGGFHSLYLTTSGAVLACGLGTSGQLGFLPPPPSGFVTVPQVTAGLPSDVTAVAVGELHSLALTISGLVYAWGRNAHGQLGLGDLFDRFTPQLVAALPPGIIAIAAGAHHSFALDAAGRVYSWGANALGQLGLGDTAHRSLPQWVVSAPPGVVAIASGAEHGLALHPDGTLRSWGRNSEGQLGRQGAGTLLPGLVAGLPPVATLGDTLGHHTVVRTVDGSIWAWGLNDFGQLGSGPPPPNTVAYPQVISGILLPPSLRAFAPATSPIGQPLTWTLTTHPAASPLAYLFDVSPAGWYPGFPLQTPGGEVLPLNPPFLQLTYGLLMSGIFSQFIGTLDPAGGAAPTLIVPLEPALVGLTLWGAGLTLDPVQPGGLGAVSNPIATLIQSNFPPLVVMGVNPISPTPNQVVTVSGSGFQQGLTLLVGGQPVIPGSVSGSQVTFAMPAGASCSSQIMIHNPDNQSATIPFNPTPLVTVVNPPSGPAAGGGSIYVQGAEFYSGCTVTVGGAPATILLLTGFLIQVVAPPGTPGQVAVVVTSPSGCAGSGSYTYQ